MENYLFLSNNQTWKFLSDGKRSKSEGIIIHLGQGTKFFYISLSIINFVRHTVVENNSNLFLFGGADSDTRTNDLFIYQIGNQSICLASLRQKEMDKAESKGIITASFAIRSIEHIFQLKHLHLWRLHKERR